MKERNGGVSQHCSGGDEIWIRIVVSVACSARLVSCSLNYGFLARGSSQRDVFSDAD